MEKAYVGETKVLLSYKLWRLYCWNNICRFAFLQLLPILKEFHSKKKKRVILSLEKPWIHIKNKNLIQFSQLMSVFLSEIYGNVEK